MASIEHVTVLFTDLENSAAVESALSPDAADELRRAHFGALRKAIRSSGGDEVKALGDGLMAVFATASAGLSSAVSMQQLVALGNTRTEPRLGLRVGLSGGEVTREGNDYFGERVIEAARLCARAAAGQILAAELLAGMAGRRTPHVLRTVGPLRLKGLPQATETVEVLWEPLGDDQTPWSASVQVDGEDFPLGPSRGMVFGRASAAGVVGLDAGDMGISAVAGSVEWQWGVWWVVNLSRKRPLLLDTGSGGTPHQLECGERFAITTPHLTVLVAGAIFTHRIDVVVPEGDLARVEPAPPSSGTLPVHDLRLTERDKAVLAALLSGYLEDFPRRSQRPLTYREAAERLGPPWSPVAVRKQVERVKERARRGGLYFEGPHANHDLADHLVANAQLVPGDLGRLTRHPLAAPADQVNP